MDAPDGCDPAIAINPSENNTRVGWANRLEKKALSHVRGHVRVRTFICLCPHSSDRSCLHTHGCVHRSNEASPPWPCSLPSLASRGWLPGRPERRREGIIIFIIDQYLEMLGIDTHCTQLSTYSHIHASAIICYRHIQCDWDGEIDYACEQMGRAHLT